MAKKSKKQKKVKKSREGKNFSIVAFPKRLLKPVGAFLSQRLRGLEKRKQEIQEEDPFEDTTRLNDNASPDTDAAEQFGHARASAIKEQLDKKIVQTRKAWTRVKLGKYGICEDCSNMIDTDRLMVYPEATFCASCQKKRE